MVRVIAQGSADQIKGNYARNILRILSQDATGLEKSLPKDCAWEQVKEGEFILHPKTIKKHWPYWLRQVPILNNLNSNPEPWTMLFMALTGREVR